MTEINKPGNPIRRADIILIAALLILATIGAALVSRGGVYADDADVRITVDGALYGVYPIGEAREIVVQGNYENRIVIEAGDADVMQVRVAGATCPGKDCVHHAPIRLGGQSIVCLPNRLSVEITGGERDIDAFTY
ncbi:MAG: NusG domain II-containing protein [Clostridiales Family XIII bacterium]|jgi:hypothetical protein|nr:NusG domain II-containing protein [Clostridiales Family XIII bacterium]